MGTYDTRGGAPISPDMQEPAISELQEKVWSFLEDLGIGDSYLNRIEKIIAEFETDQQCAADERRASGP